MHLPIPPCLSAFRALSPGMQPLQRPPESEQLDYEGEIAIVIGKAGRRIAEADALTHIAALTLCNEGTLRDWVRHAKFNVTQGKNFDHSGAMGPWLVPFVDEAQRADIQLETWVNGEVRQRDRTCRMLFPFRKIISYISTFTTLTADPALAKGYLQLGATFVAVGSDVGLLVKESARLAAEFKQLQVSRGEDSTY
ncbi:fumarylacetoacetate hydrolase family protein [Pokkaliibacter plantistimulans]|uniref:fumarylacetoacetate hydrolase family protein n=1 Tax=Pokkaliibacter plantistimulans TaxID=1635171 RepID=UPI0026C313B2|nr:fumarylacetoacetate hydrolase family protein [Pokkaliibacter plantistimulans]